MSDSRDPARMLSVLAAQFECERRAFLTGAGAFTGGNLVLAAAVVTGIGAGGRLGWVLPAIAFLANVSYTLTMDWEAKWQAIWRREVPHLERELGDGVEVLTRILEASRKPRAVRRWIKWVGWAVTMVWLLVLLDAMRAAGFSPTVGG